MQEDPQIQKTKRYWKVLLRLDRYRTNQKQHTSVDTHIFDIEDALQAVAALQAIPLTPMQAVAAKHVHKMFSRYKKELQDHGRSEADYDHRYAQILQRINRQPIRAADYCSQHMTPLAESACITPMHAFDFLDYYVSDVCCISVAFNTPAVIPPTESLFVAFLKEAGCVPTMSADVSKFLESFRRTILQNFSNGIIQSCIVEYTADGAIRAPKTALFYDKERDEAVEKDMEAMTTAFNPHSTHPEDLGEYKRAMARQQMTHRHAGADRYKEAMALYTEMSSLGFPVNFRYSLYCVDFYNQKTYDEIRETRFETLDAMGPPLAYMPLVFQQRMRAMTLP